STWITTRSVPATPPATRSWSTGAISRSRTRTTIAMSRITMPTLTRPRAPRGAGRRIGGGDLVASGARLVLVALVAALALGAGPAPRTAEDDVFNAMRANRIASPMPAPSVT